MREGEIASFTIVSTSVPVSRSVEVMLEWGETRFGDSSIESPTLTLTANGDGRATAIWEFQTFSDGADTDDRSNNLNPA